MKNALLKKKAGARKRKRKQVYLFSPRVIEGKDRQYVFNFPLLSIMGKENGHYVIENSMLSIFGVGRTRSEAMRDFAEVFDEAYKWYNELPEDTLTPKMQRLKTMLNSTVKGIVVTA